MGRIIRFFLIVVLLGGFGLSLIAAPVSKEMAWKAARLIWQQKAPETLKDECQMLVLEDVYVHHSDTLLFVFGLPNTGFVIVSGNDRALPVLAYSFESGYQKENLHEVFSGWIDFLLEEIYFAATDDTGDYSSSLYAWNTLLSGNTTDNSKNADIDPLLLTRWDQGLYYNALCPIDPDGPGGRVYAGCVATMMAMVMNYYQYPLSGYGSNGYYSSYGYLSVNYASSQYDYTAMPQQLNTHNTQVAKLIYDCGVAVDMNYSPNGSGAYMSTARDAMVQYFGYSAQSALMARNHYPGSQWVDLMYDELENGRPVMYAGYPSGGAGHAFVLDGYQSGDYFHFNWGWSGSYNGYFLLSALSPGSSNFTNWQTGITGASPAGAYPRYCNGQTLVNGIQGLINDGSGPENYQPDADCQWLLQPADLVTSVTLSFQRFNLRQGEDFLIVHAGPDTTSPVVAVFTGDTLPANLTITGNKVLLRFISQSLNSATGFDISYAWTLQLFCSGTTFLTDPSGSFSDGSGQNAYRGGTICKWQIEPPGAQSITLSFSSFQTEDGVDLVRIYNPSTVPSTLLATYSGFTIPQQVVSPSGKMLVIFQTNQSVNELGWEAQYTSLPLGANSFENSKTVKIFPVPANDYVIVSTNYEQYGLLHYLLVDAMGRPCVKGEVEMNHPLSEFYINTASLARGVYFLRLEHPNEIGMYKIVIAGD